MSSTVHFPFEGEAVTAYLRQPKGVSRAPLVFGINGLDSRKEDVIARVDDFLKRPHPRRGGARHGHPRLCSARVTEKRFPRA